MKCVKGPKYNLICQLWVGLSVSAHFEGLPDIQISILYTQKLQSNTFDSLKYNPKNTNPNSRDINKDVP